jgi:hypothetical protein
MFTVDDIVETIDRLRTRASGALSVGGMAERGQFGGGDFGDGNSRRSGKRLDD